MEDAVDRVIAAEEGESSCFDEMQTNYKHSNTLRSKDMQIDVRWRIPTGDVLTSLHKL